MSWKVRLLKQIIPAKGKPILTLDDAREYLLSVPEARHLEPVQAATQAVSMTAEDRGPIMHAHIRMAELVYELVPPLNRSKPDQPWLQRKARS